jgi:hypothetical protein
MGSAQPRPSRTDGLILSPRQLNAALRKSAWRAQRLADAFGLTVPTDDQPGSKPAKRPATKNSTSATRNIQVTQP